MPSDSKKMLTIEHIARLAKVSKGTVSKVLNNRPGISQATRERILALVKEFDFIPNSAAQALANQKTGNIGIIVPHEAGNSLSGAYWSQLITSVASTAINNGYNLLVLTPKHEGSLEEAYEPVLRTKKVDGLIIGSEHLDKKSVSRLLLQSIPFVMIGRNPEFPHYHVDVENYQAAFDIVSYMFDYGYRRPAILTGPYEYYYNQRRIAGYKAALQSHGVDEEFIHSVQKYETEDTRSHTRELFYTGGFDSLFIAAGGTFLFDVIDEVRELGISFTDYGLTVFDDYRYLDFIEPQMTAVRQPISELGSSAMEILLSLISGDEPLQSEIIIPASIISRHSCGERNR